MVKRVMKDENGENVAHLEILKVVNAKSLVYICCQKTD